MCLAITRGRSYLTFISGDHRERRPTHYEELEIMKLWTKPAVREQEVGLEVTSYLPAEIDLI